MRSKLSCHKCGQPAYKSDGDSVLWCLRCLNKKEKKEPDKYSPKIGRNEICPCGSGKKHKKCCL